MERGNAILDLSFEFALEIISYCDLLENNKKFVLSNQLMKSGTSIGANIREAQHAESKTDFIHKMKIAAKEAAETNYWLILCKRAANCPDPGRLLEDIQSIEKLLSKIISTSKRSIAH
ncbi:MAG TPA: four helix bundle protein [Bacteroidales bacterium]|nr:four helix bundle protein [Bacteroidales bacterium]